MAQATKLKVFRRALAVAVAASALVLAAAAAAEQAASDGSFAEGTAIGDATEATTGQLVGPTDDVGVADEVDITLGKTADLAEGVAVGEGSDFRSGRVVGVAEGVGIADGSDFLPGKRVVIAEGVAIDDGTAAEPQNIVPTVRVDGFGGIEGAAAAGGGSFSDEDPQQWTATVDWGDGSPSEPLTLSQTKSFQLSHVYDDDGSYLVKVTVSDNAGGSGTGTAAVTVENAAPDASLGNGGPADEGAPVEVAFTGQHDPSNADTEAGFTYRYACDGETLGDETPEASTSCTFDDDGTHTVLARILDKDGGSTDHTTDVEVNNVAPTATLANDGPVAEASPATVSFTEQHDPSSADTAAGFTYRYACDGASLGPPTSDATATCTFDDGPSEQTVLARVEDDDGAFTDYTTSVEVQNAPPGGELANSGPVAEGSPVTVTWTGQSDPSAADAAAGFVYRYACDGQTLGAPTRDSSATCTFDDGPATHTVLARIQDKDGGFSDHTTEVGVENVAPTARLVVPAETNEGATVTLALADVSDTSAADVAAGFAVEFDCGTGAGYQESSICTALENPSQAVKARITDKDGGATEYDATAAIANVAPAVTITGPPAGTLYAVGDPVSFTGTFTDPGVQDTHTATWTFDAISLTGTVVEAGGSGSTSAMTSFTSPGVYAVRLTVTDDDGAATTASTVDGADALISVYDPSAGFVTGSGWLMSPPGAYQADLAATGRATFGFVSKFVRGTTIPTGSTQFRFASARFNFASTSYQWLVIAGSKAQFKGTGAVNSSPGFEFLLTAYDGTPDRLRLKVWNGSGGVVYDNARGFSDDIDSAGPQPIGGGSIVVQR